MDRITRKTLKGDRFTTEVTQSVEYLAEHRRQTLLYGGAIVAVLAIGLSVYFYRQYRHNAAHESMAKALETYRAIVTEEERTGRVTFRTEAEKNAKALKDFSAVVNDFPRSKEAKIARYYIALVHYQMGNTAEAQKQLEKMVSEGNDNVLALARITLADLYLSQGKDEQARQLYEYLIKNPTETVPDGRAQLGMVRYLRAHKPEEARKLLTELIKRPGQVAAAAAGMLREQGQP